jgi:hypothetical protein
MGHIWLKPFRVLPYIRPFKIRIGLRITSQSQQNRNHPRRLRTSNKLPDDVDPDEIPCNVWYSAANGSHGDRFVVEIKGIPDLDDIVWRTTSSKKVTARTKLAQAVQKRNELFSEHKVLKDHERESELAAGLREEYACILIGVDDD